MSLPDGFYDLLLTDGLGRSLSALESHHADVSARKGGAAQFLADLMARQLADILEDVAGDDSERTGKQLEAHAPGG